MVPDTLRELLLPTAKSSDEVRQIIAALAAGEEE